MNTFAWSERSIRHRCLEVAALLLIAIAVAPVTAAEVGDPTRWEITPDLVRKTGADKDGNYFVGDMAFTETTLTAAEIGGVSPMGFFNGNKWPGGSIGFQLPAGIEPWQRQNFLAAAEWWRQVSGVRFHETATGTRIVVTTDSGCWSRVGRTGEAQQPLNLDSGCWSVGTIAHEMGHALGMPHEQNRGDRAPHVSVEVLDDGGGSSDCNALIAVNWGTQGGAFVTNYDFASIMHYPSTASLSSARCPSGVMVRINAISAQPPGLPSGSESACLTPLACTQTMGLRVISRRDGWAMALRYGYRIAVSSGGNGSGTVSASGQMDGCGQGCYLVSPQGSFTLNANPAPDSVVRFSGACSGQTCQFAPAGNGEVRVSFIRKSSLMAVASLVSSLMVEDSVIFADGFESPLR